MELLPYLVHCMDDLSLFVKGNSQEAIRFPELSHILSMEFRSEECASQTIQWISLVSTCATFVRWQFAFLSIKSNLSSIASRNRRTNESELFSAHHLTSFMDSYSSTYVRPLHLIPFLTMWQEVIFWYLCRSCLW